MRAGDVFPWRVAVPTLVLAGLGIGIAASRYPVSLEGAHARCQAPIVGGHGISGAIAAQHTCSEVGHQRLVVAIAFLVTGAGVALARPSARRLLQLLPVVIGAVTAGTVVAIGLHDTEHAAGKVVATGAGVAVAWGCVIIAWGVWTLLLDTDRIWSAWAALALSSVGPDDPRHPTRAALIHAAVGLVALAAVPLVVAAIKRQRLSRAAPTGTSPSGWYPDPSRRHEFRWWDGIRWSENVSDGGSPSVDPLTAPLGP